MGLTLITPPMVEPVSLAELKEFLRLDGSDTSQDSTIQSLALAARMHSEAYTKKRFITQSWRLLMDFFPGYIDLKLAGSRVSSPFVSGSNALLVGIRYALLLPYPPVQAVTDFIYQDANGSVTSMVAGTDYIQDLQANP